MKFCMIVPNSPYLYNQWTIEPLGAIYVAQAAEPYCDESVVRVWEEEPFYEADVYGISVVTPHYEQVREIIAELRYVRPNAIIVLGGAHCTFLPEETLADLQPDFVVAGEGEIAIKKILSGEWWDVPGIYTPTSVPPAGAAPVPDLTMLSIPDHSMLLHDYYPNPAWTDEPGGAIMASRGCPFGGSYCGKSIGRAARWRNPRQVALEMHQYTQWRFEDDDIFGNAEWFDEFCKHVPADREWRCSARATSITPEVLEQAKKAGCMQVGIGVETANPALLKIHCPSKSVERNTAAIKMIMDHGMQSTAFLIAGLPGETEESIQDTIDWVQTVKPDKFTVSACTPYPGTPLWRHPEKYGITQLDFDGDYMNFRQLGREDEDVAFVFDTEWADRYELTRLWKKLRGAATYGIAEDTRASDRG